MRFASLGSGSEGNALVVEAGRTRVLLDCGFGPRETVARLSRLGLAPEDLSCILVTHEHSDHIGGAFRFAGRYRIEVWMTCGTLAAAPRGRTPLPPVRTIDGDASFSLGDMEILPFPVPHDAREPVQFAFSDGRFRLGVLTDAGVPTAHMRTMLSGCDALVLECNHDAGMLDDGDYPPALKRRIAGRFGHLDNAGAADLLAALDNRRLQHIIAAHLSKHNNRADLARGALAGALGCGAEWVGVATQESGFGWRELR